MTVLFAVLLAAIVTAGIIAAYEGLWDATASPDTKRWGRQYCRQ